MEAKLGAFDYILKSDIDTPRMESLLGKLRDNIVRDDVGKTEGEWNYYDMEGEGARVIMKLPLVPSAQGKHTARLTAKRRRHGIVL